MEENGLKWLGFLCKGSIELNHLNSLFFELKFCTAKKSSISKKLIQ